MGHVARTGNECRFAGDTVAAAGQHFLSKIDAPITGRFGTQQGPTPLETFAGQDTTEAVDESLVLAEQKTNLTAADADVARRHIRIRPDMAVELGHQGLAEPHHFLIAFAFGVKVRAPLAATHGERGQGILEHLFEGQELEDAERDRGVEPKSTLIRSDGAVHLDSKSTVELDLAAVVDPGNAKHEDPFRFHDAFQDPRLPKSRMRVDVGVDRFDDLPDGLVELRFAGVLLDDLVHECIDAGGERGGRGHAETPVGRDCRVADRCRRRLCGAGTACTRCGGRWPVISNRPSHRTRGAGCAGSFQRPVMYQSLRHSSRHHCR